MVSVSVVTIGDELLIGHTLDTNAHFISGKMNEAGFSVVLRLSVGDTLDRITEAFKTAENSDRLRACFYVIPPSASVGKV